jgi:hypothetical protein
MTGIKRHFVTLFGATLLTAAGCASKPQETGFLSTYQNLEPQSSTFMRYVADDATLKKYSTFIVDPVRVHFYDQEETKDLTPEDIQHLQQFMYAELTKDLSEGGFKLTNVPGPGTARIRIGLTNL